MYIPSDCVCMRGSSARLCPTSKAAQSSEGSPCRGDQKSIDRHILLHYLPLLKKSCVRQVVLDKWFPLKTVLSACKRSVVQRPETNTRRGVTQVQQDPKCHPAVSGWANMCTRIQADAAADLAPQVRRATRLHASVPTHTERQEPLTGCCYFNISFKPYVLLLLLLLLLLLVVGSLYTCIDIDIYISAN